MEAQSNANTLDAAEDTSSSKKKKIIATSAAILLALALAMSGTFAWSSLQSAMNVSQNTVNAGGRLHDDFVYIKSGAQPAAYVSDETLSTTDSADDRTKENTYHDKDIYVENYQQTDVTTGAEATNVYARVRLLEYMELDKASIGNGTSRDDSSTWDIHWANDSSTAFSSYFTWDTGNTVATTYMPTFNTVNSSDAADIRGAYDNAEGPYAEYIKYALNKEVADPNDTSADPVKHNAKTTGTATVISMEQWKANPEAGDYWVYDADGWVYWANPIEPGTATGLLLNDIEMTSVPDSDWYYAIDAQAQIVSSSEWTAKGSDYFITAAGANSATPDENLKMSGDAFYLLCTAAGNDRDSAYTFTSLTAENNATYAAQDSYVQMTAVAHGPLGDITDPNEFVWTVSGAGGTSTISQSGLVHVATNAYVGQELTVTAALKQYPTVIGTCTIPVNSSTRDTKLAALKSMPISTTQDETITIDGISWYKLAKDESGNALIWSSDAISWNSSRTLPFGSDSHWANSDNETLDSSSNNVRKYLNGDFLTSLPILKDLAVETPIYTRTDYKSEYNSDAITTGGKTPIEPAWYTTRDKAFVLSEADLFGTTGSVVDASDTHERSSTAKNQKDYTIPIAEDQVGQPAVSTDLRPYDCDFTYWSWLRSPRANSNFVAYVYIDGNMSSAHYNDSKGALRPAMWVDLSSVTS